MGSREEAKPEGAPSLKLRSGGIAQEGSKILNLRHVHRLIALLPAKAVTLAEVLAWQLPCFRVLVQVASAMLEFDLGEPTLDPCRGRLVRSGPAAGQPKASLLGKRRSHRMRANGRSQDKRAAPSCLSPMRSPPCHPETCIRPVKRCSGDLLTSAKIGGAQPWTTKRRGLAGPKGCFQIFPRYQRAGSVSVTCTVQLFVHSSPIAISLHRSARSGGGLKWLLEEV
jgi:hypothetical protein